MMIMMKERWMADTALAQLEAYADRKAWLSRATARTLAARIRHVEPAHAAALANIADLQVSLESAYAEVSKFQDRLEASRAMNGRQAAAMSAVRDDRAALEREVAELRQARDEADEALKAMAAPPAGVSVLDAWAIVLLAMAGTWWLHG